jgi:hypothetical protein
MQQSPGQNGFQKNAETKWRRNFNVLDEVKDISSVLQ